MAAIDAEVVQIVGAKPDICYLPIARIVLPNTGEGFFNR